MPEQSFTKKDWALFRVKIGEWQEIYMDRLNQEYIALLSGEGAPSEKFWQLDKRIRNDRRSRGVQLELRKSTMAYDIAAFINSGIIGDEDLADFSDELRDTVRAIILKENRHV